MSDHPGSPAPDSVSADARAAFERDGFHFLRTLFSPNEAAEWRERINAILELPTGHAAAVAGATHTLADGITTNSEFWPIIFNERLLSTVRALIGDEIRYTQHSDLHINLPGGRWHRDNACREFGVGADWDERVQPYRVVRIAIYLSNFSDSGSSLVVLPGTHRMAFEAERMDADQFLREDVPRNRELIASAVEATLDPGDVLLFDAGTLHAAGANATDELKLSVVTTYYGADNAPVPGTRSAQRPPVIAREPDDA